MPPRKRSRKRVKAIKNTRKQRGGDNKKVIVSMTTTPKRIDKLKDVIENVLKQTYPIDHIEINIPEYNLRTNELYVVPDWLPTMNKVQIHRTPDYGPITKIAPTLLRYKGDSSVYIWAIDDDFIYPQNTLEELIKAYKSKSIICYQAWKFDYNLNLIFYEPEYNGNVDVIEGYASVLYHSSLIKDDFKSYLDYIITNDNTKRQDDLILSNYFAKYKINKIKLKLSVLSKPMVELSQGKNSNALHLSGIGNHVAAKNAYLWLKENNMAFL